MTRRDATLFRYAPDDVRDCSATLLDLEAFPVTWLRISCQFSFASAAARRDFSAQRDAFYRDNEARDRHVDFRQTLSLLAAASGGGHVAWSRDTAVYNPDVQPWYASVAVYWLASLLTLSWPLRVVIQWRTATVDYVVHKAFDCRSATSSQDNSDVISVTSLETATSSSSNINCSVSSRSVSGDSGSVVLDEADVANCCLVPSYSQAILMDSRTFADRKTDHRHHHYDALQQQQQQQQQQSRRRGHYSVRLRRVQSCASVQRRRVTSDVKPSASLTTHLYKSAAAAAAILMTSRPPSYDTAMCTMGHVTGHRGGDTAPH